MFRWDRDPRLFGVPVPLTDITRRLDWDQPAADLDDWIESVDLWLLEDVENGFVHRARRHQVGHYIELREPGWPDDRRFYLDAVAPGDGDSWLRVPFMAEAGLDPAPAVALRDTGRLISWVTASENSTGGPYVGHACVTWVDETTAFLEAMQISDGVPSTVPVDLASLAAHLAAAAGALKVVTALELDRLELIGFRHTPEGTWVVDTSFLDEDPDGARALLEQSLESPGRWGQDRDLAGRHIPPGRLGRWMHRLRHGRTGSRPRRYVG